MFPRAGYIEWSYRCGRCGGRTVPARGGVPGRLRCRLHTIRPPSLASRFREGRLFGIPGRSWTMQMWPIAHGDPHRDVSGCGDLHHQRCARVRVAIADTSRARSPDMGHRLFPLLSIQVSPVPTKGVPELACPVLKSLQTLGLAVVGSGRSQAPAWGIRQSPRVALWQLSESGRWPRRAEQFEIAPPVYHPERDRLPSSPPSPAVVQSSGICRFSITSSPNHRKRRLGTMLPPGKKCPTLSDQALSRQVAQS